MLFIIMGFILLGFLREGYSQDQQQSEEQTQEIFKQVIQNIIDNVKNNPQDPDAWGTIATLKFKMNPYDSSFCDDLKKACELGGESSCQFYREASCNNPKYFKYSVTFLKTTPDNSLFSFNRREENGSGTLSISPDIYVSYHKMMGVTSVNLPLSMSKSLSNKISSMAKQRKDKIDNVMDVNLSFLSWFGKNVLQDNNPEAVVAGIYYFMYLIKDDRGDVVQMFISGYLDDMKENLR